MDTAPDKVNAPATRTGAPQEFSDDQDVNATSLSRDDLAATGYADAVDLYRPRGWQGILPLPRGRKSPPPDGFTGYGGDYPSGADIEEWKTGNAGGNVGLRLPRTVVGIDVDAYEKNGQQKQGARCLAEAESESRWGVLPDTYVSTSRDDRVSGIRLYSIPEGTKLENVIRFPDKGIEGGIEVVQWWHRYVVVSPSFNPDNDGKQYHWYHSSDWREVEPPRVADLPELPAAWIKGLRDTKGFTTVIGEDGDNVAYDIRQALTDGTPSPAVHHTFEKALAGVRSGSRHDTTRGNVLALLALGKETHPGVKTTVEALGMAFVGQVAPDRGHDTAVHEFRSMVFGRGAARALAGPLIDGNGGFFLKWEGRGSLKYDKPTTPTPAADDAPKADSAGNKWGVIDGAAFILDAPQNIKPVWGEGNTVLWADGEGFMLAGMQGLGKTTLAGSVLRGLLGLDETLLGLPFADTGETILYLAMDRPRQIQRSLARQFTAEEREILKARVVIRPGPPLADLAKNPEMLRDMMRETGAGLVIVDSLKDAAVGLSDDEVGSGYNRARQYVLADGRNVMDLHHMRKNIEGRPTINDIYGSTWLTSGCGSVVILTGQPGDPIVGFWHVKPPVDEYGPFKLEHDGTAGQVTIWHGADLVEMLRATGVNGLTAKQAACALYDAEKPSAAEVEKARRKLDKLMSEHPNLGIEKVEGTKGRGPSSRPTTWYLPEL